MVRRAAFRVRLIGPQEQAAFLFQALVEGGNGRRYISVLQMRKCAGRRFKIGRTSAAQIFRRFQVLEEAFSLIFGRRLRFPAGCGEEHTEALEAWQPAPRKRSFTLAEVLAESVDDVRDGLIVSGCGDD